MSQTSKKQFDVELKKEIWKLFWREIEKSGKNNSEIYFLDGFLTKNEIIMFEKRLAVLYFLSQGESLRETSKKADVTKKTVIFIKRGLKKNKIQVKNYSKHYKSPRKISRYKIPDYHGKNRWAFLRN